MNKPFHDPVGFIVAESLVTRSSGSSGGRNFQAIHDVEPTGAASWKEFSQGSRIAMLSCVKAIQRLVHKAAFVKRFCKIPQQVSYQGKWSGFLHWGCKRSTDLCKATVQQIYVYKELRLGACNRGLLASSQSCLCPSRHRSGC